MADSLLDLHKEKFKKFYEGGLLDPAVHYRLIENVEAYADEAGIRVGDVSAPLSPVCNTMEEQSYVRHIAANRGHSLSGMYYQSEMDPPIIDRMRAICGTLIRNFEPAKLIPQGRLFDMIIDNVELDDYKVICLPDLMDDVFSIGDGLRRSVSTLFIDRYINQKQVVLGKIDNLKSVREKFGSQMADIISNKYMKIGG